MGLAALLPPLPCHYLVFCFEDQNGVMLDIPDERDQNGVMLDIPD